MHNHIDFNHLFTFPFKKADDRKHFLIGTLVYLASFIIPILPLLIVTGYQVRIMRQILRNEKAHMEPWDNWQEMFIDGAKLFGVRLVYILPIFILMVPFAFGMFAFPFMIESGSETLEQFGILFPLLFGASFIFITPLSLAIGIFTPIAEIHSVSKNDFASGFHIREWWAVFRKNWSGVLLAYVISFAVSFVLVIITQFAMMTIVLICILPLVMPAISMYMMLVVYTAFTQAYKNGADQLTDKPVAILQG